MPCCADFYLEQLNYFVRAMRWRVLLSAERRIRPLTVFWANMAGYLGNSFLPAGQASWCARWRWVKSRNQRQLRSCHCPHRAVVGSDRPGNDRYARIALPARNIIRLDPRLAGLGCFRRRWLLVLLLAPHLSDFFRRLLGLLPMPVAWQPRLESLLVRFLMACARCKTRRALTFLALTGVICWQMGWGRC